MEPEILWDIWYYFILYGIWVILGLELLHKILFVNSLKKNLGKSYIKYPDSEIERKWRFYILIFLILVGIYMVILSFIKSISFFYAVPVLIVAGIVYVNGILKNGTFNFYSTLYYSGKGFSVLPDKFKLFSSRFYGWTDVEKATVKPNKSYTEIEMNFKDRNRRVVIRIKGKMFDDYVDILKKHIRDF
jgi:hypothetical protein